LRIPLGEIGIRDRYSPSFLPDLDPLVASLREVGQICEVLLREGEEGLEVVSGLKRLLALEAMGEEGIRARIVKGKEFPPSRAVKVAIAHNIPSGLNLVERAISVDKLEREGVPREEIIRRWLPLMGLGPRMELFMRLKALLRVPDGIKAYIVQKGLTLSGVSPLLTFQQQELEALTPLLFALKPGENKLREILLSLRDLSLREGVGVEEILSEVEGIVQDAERPPGERLEVLRQWLRRRLYPHLHEAERRLDELQKELDLPKGSLLPPPGFEGDRYRLVLSFADKKDFLRWVKRLWEAAQRLQKEEKDPFRELLGLG